MFNVGWPELFIIVAIAVLVIGPQDMPKVMVFLGRVFRRFQYIKYALSQQFDDIMREADMDDIRKSVNFEAQEREAVSGDRDEEAFDEAAFDEDVFDPTDIPVEGAEGESVKGQNRDEAET